MWCGVLELGGGGGGLSARTSALQKGGQGDLTYPLVQVPCRPFKLAALWGTCSDRV